MSPKQSHQTLELLVGKMPSRQKRMLLHFQASHSMIGVEEYCKRIMGGRRTEKAGMERQIDFVSEKLFSSIKL